MDYIDLGLNAVDIKSPVPVVVTLGDVESFKYYSSMREWVEDNPDRRAHRSILVNHILHRVSLVCVCTVTDFESLQNATVRYLNEHQPRMWQTFFPIDWTPTLTNQFLDYIVECQMPIQIDVSRRESMANEYQEKFYPTHAPVKWVRGILDYHMRYTIDPLPAEAPPYRKKWEK